MQNKNEMWARQQRTRQMCHLSSDTEDRPDKHAICSVKQDKTNVQSVHQSGGQARKMCYLFRGTQDHPATHVICPMKLMTNQVHMQSVT